MQKCTSCKIVKELEFFPLNNKKKNGRDSWCKKCRSAYRSLTRRGKYRHCITDENLKIYLAENKVCNICYKVSSKMFLDHNHKTNKIRGMLCMKCNLAIGHFNDNIELLEKAIKYLKNPPVNKLCH